MAGRCCSENTDVRRVCWSFWTNCDKHDSFGPSVRMWRKVPGLCSAVEWNSQRDDFYRAELKSAIKKSTWSLSLVLKASAMTRVASRCSIPLSDTPFTSRITWPTRNCPQICTEPPFWKTERERKRERNKQRKSQTLRKRETIYQKCERKDKWEMGEKMSACSLQSGTLYWEVISWPPVSHSIKIKCLRTGRKR